MLARSREFKHDALPLSIRLPLVVPSFTSKGFDPLKGTQPPRYETGLDLAAFASTPARSVLVSAYDLHFNNLDTENQGAAVPATQHVLNSDLLILDSGGYELSEYFDSCEPRTGLYSPSNGPFTAANHVDVIKSLEKLPRIPPICIASFDNDYVNKPLATQLQQASTLFAQFPYHISSFLFKPTHHDQRVTFDAITAEHLDVLRGFAIVGVTADELGANLWDRLEQLALLRQTLDEAGIAAPIHVWGGLDPLITPLYFFAGAEIFDGVSWLRYAFHKGIAVNRISIHLLNQELGIMSPRELERATRTVDNLKFLGQLSEALRRWAESDGTEYDGFSVCVRDLLRKAYTQMKTQLKGV